MRRRHIRCAVVYWDDAYKTADPEPAPGVIQVSAGVLVANNKHCVKLAQIVDPWGEWEDRDVLTIPRGMVRNVEVFEPEFRV